ncbi:MAG: iron-sulfur cluster assembly scaffold protein [Pirellulales bacterium]
MPRFSAALMEHFQEPRHRGPMMAADAVGVAGTPGQGRFLACYLRIQNQRVSDASFACNGCGVTIACGSALVELTLGKTLAECHSIGPEDIDRILDGIPADVADRASFAVSALRAALDSITPNWPQIAEPTSGLPDRDE